MASEVKSVPLDSFLLEKPRNGLYKGKEFQLTSGNRWIKMSELYSLDFLSNEETEERLLVNNSEIERFSCTEGDLLFGRTSLTFDGVGDCLLVNNIIDKPVFESNLFRLRFDQNKAFPLFFYYFFKSRYGRNIIQKIAKQTAATSITAADLIQEDIPSLSLQSQMLIAEKIHIFDKKITLNRQINQTLEQMAQTLFKSWFVDFDPVIDNALDAGFFEQDLAFSEELLCRVEMRKAVRESDGFKPLSEDIRQLFPDSLEECSEPALGLGGWAPQGWNNGCISDVAYYRSERINTSELTLNNYISTENMLVDRKGIQQAVALPTVNSVPAFTSGTILISNIRPYFKKIWLAKGDGGYSNDVLGFEVKDQGTEGYLFNLMYQDSFFDFMMATSKGSKMPRGDKKAILGWELVVPPLKVRTLFSKKVNDFYTSSNTLNDENIILGQLRDTLLLKLISGELSLSDIKIDIPEETLI